MDYKQFVSEMESLIDNAGALGPEEFSRRARTMLVSVVSGFSDFEKLVETKNALIKKYSDERKVIIKKLQSATEGEKSAYERLADLDISRHAEISDMAHELERLRVQNQGLLKGSAAEVYAHEYESMKDRLLETEQNLEATTATLNNLEERYNSLIEHNRSAVAEKEREIEDLKAFLEHDRSDEVLALKNKLTSMASVDEGLGERYEAEIGRLEGIIKAKDVEIESLGSTYKKEMDSLWEKLDEADKTDRPDDSDDRLKEQYEEEIKRLSADVFKKESEAQELKTSMGREIETLRERANETLILKNKLLWYSNAEAEMKAKFDSELKRLILSKEEEIEAIKLSHEEEIKRAGMIVEARNMESAELKRLLEESGKASENLEQLNEIGQRLQSLVVEKQELEAVFWKVKQDKDAEIAALKKTVEELNGKISETADEPNDGLQAQLETANESISSMQSELDASNQEVENLRKSAEELKIVSSERDNIKAELDRLKEDARRSQADFGMKVDSLNRELDGLNVKLRQTSEENDKLTKDIAEIQEELLEQKKEASEAKTYKSSSPMPAEDAGLSEDSEEPQKPNKPIEQPAETKQESENAAPLVETQYFAPKKKFALLKTIATIIAVMLILGGGGFAVYHFRGDIKTLISGPKPVVKAVEPIKPAWAGTREYELDDYNIVVSFLTPDTLDSMGLVRRITEEENAKYFFYSLEIKSSVTCIPDILVESPRKNIYFINDQGGMVKFEEIAGLDASKKVIYKTGACLDDKNGVVFLRYYLALDKLQRPKGITIENLIVNTPVIIK